ncbi:hypothetical protein AYO44_03860 [Planctomycetaceae bacterium SCGC AG-212-F19]|nr:hypothetical protein AYO44_03860 [Planctomycetaceae bacterium SCGC AG-212-F19]
MPQEAPAIESPWYKAEEVAVLFDIHQRTLWQWVAAGRLPAPRKVGRRWSRWPKEQIDQILETWGLQKPSGRRTA